MADTKISALTALTGANTAPDDLLAIVDTSAVTTKSITRQELQTFNLGTITTDIKVLDLSATWNAAGVTFTGLKFNVTDTASSAASLLMDLQVGGVSKIIVQKAGTLCIGANGVDNIMVRSGTTGPFIQSAQSGISLIVQPSSNGTVFVRTRLAIQDYGGSNTIYLTTDADNTLALRNGTNAQTFNRYRSYADASNYSRLTSKWNSTTAVIHAEGLGTGTDGNIAFNDAALATTATVGYVMIPSCAGAPTGVPADIPTGQVALHFDSTNNKLYVYDGGWLSTAALT